MSIAETHAGKQEPSPADFFRLSLDQYHDMVRKGVLADDAPVELLDGWLITKMSKNPPHRISVEMLRKLLPQFIPAGWDTMFQQPITLESSEPEPDAVVTRGSQEGYSDRHPGGPDIGLVIEVAEASLERDRGWKRRLYAHSGIPVYWLLNLVDRCLEVYSDPVQSETGWDYRCPVILTEVDMAPLVLDGQEIAAIPVKAVLPAR